MNRKCLCFGQGLKKDQVAFEKVKRNELLSQCSVVHFGHNLVQLNEIYSKVKDKKPDRILFDGYSEDEVTDAILHLEKKFPGNSFEYGRYSAGRLLNIDKSKFSKNKKREEVLEAAEA